MALLASSNVTWGISGPDFLAGYGFLTLAVLLGTVVARGWLAAGAPSAGEFAGRPHDVAYLNGGSALAVLSALSSMRVARTIIAAGHGRVRAGERPAADADDLERAIHLAAVVPLDRRELVKNPIVGTALEQARQRLVEAGLLLSAAQRHRIRRLGLWMVAVGVLGLVRLQAGAANGAPIGYLMLELLVVGLLAAVLLCWAPKRSRRGSVELSRLRAQHNEISPRMRPDWTVYGPAVAGLGVGIFGTGALWASDPAFAAEVQAQRVAATMGGSGSSGGYYAGCGGTGYSGGGCGAGGGGGGGCGGGCGGGG